MSIVLRTPARRTGMARVVVLTPAVALLMLGGVFWSGAARADQTPGPHLPVALDLGPLHVSIDLPLDVPALLGAQRNGGVPPVLSTPVGSTPVSSTPIGPTPSAQPIPPPPTHTATAVAAVPTSVAPVPAPRTVRTAPLDQAQNQIVVAPGNGVEPSDRAAASTSRPATAPRRVGALQQPSLFQRAERPAFPVLVLVTVVLSCALGTALIVAKAGRRSRRRT